MSIHQKINYFDAKLIHASKCYALPFARFSIFLVYFWFGLLKILDLSPASPLVISLLERTMPWIAPDAFLFTFGIIEVLIGILFLIPHFERLATFALVLHLVTTVMPLFLLPQIAWSGFLVPTLEGQYIIKNILLVALAIVIFSHLKASRHEHK